MSELLAGSRFDEEYLTDCEPIDWPEFGRWMRLTPGQRIQTMLHAHRLAAGPVRGRLRRRYLHASAQRQVLLLILCRFRHNCLTFPSSIPTLLPYLKY